MGKAYGKPPPGVQVLKNTLLDNKQPGRARLGVFGGGGHAALRRPLVVSSRHGHALLRVLQGLALGALVKGRSQKEISNHKCAAWCFSGDMQNDTSTSEGFLIVASDEDIYI